jgi:DNA-directed RNA polymerase specialized sigma24 family protein
MTRRIAHHIPETGSLLTADEAKAAGDRWLAGDPAARETLIVGHRALVARHVEIVLKRHPDGLFGLGGDDDLFSAGCVRLVKAVDGLKHTANVQGYLAKAIERAVNKEIGVYARHPMRPVSDWPEWTWEYQRWPTETDFEDAIIEAARGELDEEKCRELLRLCRHGCTFKEIEAAIGTPPSTAFDRLRRMEKKLVNHDAADRKSGQDAVLILVSRASTQPEEDRMDPTFESFVKQHTHQRPDARMKLTDLIGKFRSTLEGRDARLWPRWSFLKELEAGGYVLAKDSDRVSFVLGLSFQPPRQWAVDEAGRMRLRTVA